jgi:RsiW-degrading membrane proteinase PrsW (M82 family)
MKLKAAAILLIIVFSLIPGYLVYKYLQKAMRPRESMRRFIIWLLAAFALIFAYTFLVVFAIKMLFPEA